MDRFIYVCKYDFIYVTCICVRKRERLKDNSRVDRASHDLRDFMQIVMRKFNGVE